LSPSPRRILLRPTWKGRLERDEGDDVLDLKRVDLGELAYALEDHSDFTEWWFNPETGEIEPWSVDMPDAVDPDLAHPEERGFVSIEPLRSNESYADLQDFTALVRDPRARDLLERAIAGRGAFRRFKDTLFDLPELREAWFKFSNARMERRALQWLADRGIVDEETAEAAAPPEPELPELSGAFDPLEIAAAAARDLRGLYGERLRNVLLFGSWARGDAHPESDIDLLVVLDRVESPWEELERMDDVLWRHSIDNDTLVTAFVLAEEELERPRVPAVIRAKAEGRSVG
jgi:predicted nucleotidyltransferase